jgi:hypothetical protein
MLLYAATARAEEPARPDFSGSWTVGSPAPGGEKRVRGDMGSGWGSPLTITQDAGQLTVSYVFFAKGDLQPPLTFTYALDGSETKNSVMMGRGIQDQASHAHWEAGKLVVVTTHQLIDPASPEPIAFDVTQTLSLASPKTLVVETTRPGVRGGEPNSTRVTYSKH